MKYDEMAFMVDAKRWSKFIVADHMERRVSNGIASK